MIQLPEKFEIDTQGKDTYLVPLIIIDDRLYLSTSKVKLGDVYYDPLLKSIGDIQESIDIMSKKFKISSVNLSFYNYEYNTEILSEKLYLTGAINSKLDIYWKSQSAETLDDCLKVYSGYIVNVRETKDSTLDISVEDMTEKTLHKDLPIRNTPFENIPVKHKNKPIPIVYGIVDKAPCVYMSEGVNQEVGTAEYVIAADDKYIYQTFYPYIYENEKYGIIKERPDLLISQKDGTIFENVSDVQYVIDSDNKIIVPKSIDISDMTQDDLEKQNTTKNLITFNIVECEMLTENSTYSGGTYTQEWTVGDAILQARKGASTKLLCFSDAEGLNFSSNINHGVYIMPKLFEGEGGMWITGGVGADIIDFQGQYYQMPFEKWFWWNNGAYCQGQTDENGNQIDFALGRNKMNFDLGELAGESKLLTELPLNLAEQGGEVFYSKITLYYDFGCKIEEYAPLNENGGVESYPLIKAFYGDSENIIEENLWAVGDTEQNTNSGTSGNIGDAAVQDPFVVTTYGSKETTVDSSLNTTNITIGLSSGNSNTPCGGIMQWFKISKLKAKREYLVDNFNDMLIFANVYGRVDNIAGTYTGDPELTVGDYTEATYTSERGQRITGSRKPAIKQPIGKPIASIQKNIAQGIAKPVSPAGSKIGKKY